MLSRTTTRRVLLGLAALIAVAWVVSYLAPRQIRYTTSPRPDPDSDFTPSDKRYAVRLVSERGQVMLMRGWNWGYNWASGDHFSLSRPEYSAQTLPQTFWNRLGFESFKDNGGSKGTIVPFWFLFAVPLIFFAATFIRRRRGPRGFAVEIPHKPQADE